MRSPPTPTLAAPPMSAAAETKMAAPLLRPLVAGTGGRRVRLVTFDLDDCLWDSVAVMTRSEEARQAALAAEFPRIAERWGWREFRTEVMQRLADTRPEIRHSPTDLQQEGLRWCAAEAGYRDEAERVVEVGGVEDARGVLDVDAAEGVLEDLQHLHLEWNVGEDGEQRGNGEDNDD